VEATGVKVETMVVVTEVGLVVETMVVVTEVGLVDMMVVVVLPKQPQHVQKATCVRVQMLRQKCLWVGVKRNRYDRTR